MGPPSGQGPLLLATAALSSGTPYALVNRTTDLETIRDGVEHWLNDADLAGVRDEQALGELPADEREQWQKLWSEVRSLRDRTAPPKTAPPVGK
jgi:hypothetical protein